MVTCPQVAESEDYIDDLWFLLHHSDDKDRLVIGLTCYLDDSGSDDGSQMVEVDPIGWTKIRASLDGVAG